MKHWLRLSDCTPETLGRLVQCARRLKAGEARDEARVLRDRVLGMVYFNPSLRTRMSFEVGMRRFGGHAVTLDVGGNVWQLEHRDGAVMDGDAAEHIREAAPVLSRYCDVLGVRTFARLKDAAEDAADGVLASFARHATVPVVSLESAYEHPCQGLADRMTIEEQLGSARGRRFVLTWAPHVKGLPLAVPHSAVLAAASAGLHVTVAHPAGYELGKDVMAKAQAWCRQAGTQLEVSTQQLEACRGADIVYVKSWGSPALYGDAAAQTASLRRGRSRRGIWARRPASCTACPCAATWSSPTRRWTTRAASWSTRRRTACGARSRS
jgi:N-acetylornithine carbamoyltransferase